MDVVLGNHDPHDFNQNFLKNHLNFQFYLLHVEGENRSILLWALKSMENYDRNKIVFALPTQVTSNAMWKDYAKCLVKERLIKKKSKMA